MRSHESSRAAPTVLIYELLDAHDDTAHMAAELTCDPVWQAHVEYLRALQRKGREVLAQMAVEADRTYWPD
jgi:hypothetical protein